MRYRLWMKIGGLVVAGLLPFGAAYSADFDGYVTSREGVVHNPYNECIHAGYWSSALAHEDCDAVPKPPEPEVVEVVEEIPEPPAPEAEVAVEEPAPAPAPAPRPVVRAAPRPITSVEVQAGQSLWSISAQKRVYGESHMWPLLLCANADQIKDADLIYPGQILRINRRASSAEIATAMDHSRKRGMWDMSLVEDADLEYRALNCR